MCIRFPNINLLIYLLAVIKSVTAGRRGESCRVFFGVFFCYSSVRSTRTSSWSGHSAFRNLRPAPCFQLSHVFFGCCRRFYSKSPAAPGVRPFISPSHLLDGLVCVTKLEPEVPSAAVVNRFFFSPSRGKFSTFSCNHSLIAKDCQRREGAVIDMSAGSSLCSSELVSLAKLVLSQIL